MLRIVTFTLFTGSIMFAATDKNTPSAQLPAELSQKALANPVKVKYTNYRGETAVRTIVPIRFYFGTTEYHPEEQWLVELWDVDRGAIRIYALKEITEWFVK
jgi:hypothetical protein